ncbi:helix-turn-helix domain-containing protein [Streptomyces sp. SID10815]|uniref:Winged helix-turn-helix domain-containing protein n=1 Tax=Streptomyces similanensis TaxID=1274988 RepID=A0ABP9K2Q7_9ACTN|nr:helix-turn-helix domain-containing protein [Streptomyces sp. SID10815]NEA45446.1 helix-turn-helix transcriptional regulator [Streptomyces sp. SID10815]
MAERPETRVLTGPDLKVFYKALSNPVRRDILSYLGEHGEANSTSVAKALGESTGTTSYHLRKLAELNLIAEIGERSSGRERWWRSLMRDIHTPPGLEMTADEREAAVKIGALKMTQDLTLVVRAYSGHDTSAGWNRIHRSAVWMTKDQAAAFAEEYQALLRRYATEPGDRPDGARRMAVRLVVLPDEECGFALPQELEPPELEPQELEADPEDSGPDGFRLP